MQKTPNKPKSLWERLFGQAEQDPQQAKDPQQEFLDRLQAAADKERAKKRDSRIRELAELLLVEHAKHLDPRTEKLSPRVAEQCLEQAARIYELARMTENQHP